MRQTRWVQRWILLALLSAGSAFADVVADLYSASVPVQSQSAEVMAAASRQALSEVLVKVSGSTELLKSPVIAAALGDARSHVQQYAYVRGDASAALSIRFAFDGPFITNLVTRAGAPLWTANRPLVLAWVVAEDAQGRHFISRDGTPTEAKWVAEEFARRGVPVQLPLFDLVDVSALSTESVWGLDAVAIQAASARYNVQNVVAGHLATVSDGNATGEWVYLYEDKRINHAVTAPDLQAFLRDGVNMVAVELASRYAAAPTAGQGASMLMTVTGVSSYADYAAIITWLEGLELVKYANIEKVQGDRIEVRLQAQADASRMAAIIELNDRLLPVPGLEAGAQLNYQWRN